MSIDPLHPVPEYHIQTPVFEGPLDLLLDLIEHAQLDITTLSLARVTDQYLSFLYALQERDPDHISAFIVVAAKLLQIKSTVLLPKPPALDEEIIEDPGLTLVEQLKEYRKFKQIAMLLEQREKAGLKTFLRLSPALVVSETKFEIGDITLKDLLKAAEEALGNGSNLVSLDEVVSIQRTTVREKIERILTTLQESGDTNFFQLVDENNRVEIVITFLAILELIKQNFIDVVQETPFEEIRLQQRQTLVSSSDIEIEF